MENTHNMNIDKTTVSNKRQILSDAVTEGWITDFDLDSNEVFIERWSSDNEGFRTFRHTFTMTDTKAEISEEGTEVIRTTEFKDVEESMDKTLTDKVINVLDKYFGGSRKEEINVIKQFGDNTEMTCIEPLYTAPMKSDGDGDTMSAETIVNMVESINKANEDGRLQNGLFHKHNTESWYLDKAWVNPTECQIGDTIVPEGQPIAKTVFTNAAAFELRKSGDIAGLSIGARATSVVDVTKSADKLKELQSSRTPSREIIGTHFDWEHPELTYTSRAQGGASHMQNEILNVTKAKKASKGDLLDEEISILKEIGEEFISLEKHLGEDNANTPSSDSTDGNLGEDNLPEEGINKTMSDNTVTREEFVALQKALAVSKAELALNSYGFDTELNKALAESFASLKDTSSITAAFDALIARGDEAVDKAKAEAPVQETDLQKALGNEAGEAGEPEVEVEKSFLDKVMAHQDGGAK